jgi:hypothetical protein
MSLNTLRTAQGKKSRLDKFHYKNGEAGTERQGRTFGGATPDGSGASQIFSAPQ